MTREEYRRHKREYYQRRRATDPAWVERQRKRLREQRATPDRRERERKRKREWKRRKRATDPVWRKREQTQQRERLWRTRQRESWRQKAIDPAFRERMQKQARERRHEYYKHRCATDPEFRENNRKQAREYYQNKRADPAWLEQRNARRRQRSQDSPKLKAHLRKYARLAHRQLRAKQYGALKALKELGVVVPKEQRHLIVRALRNLGVEI